MASVGPVLPGVGFTYGGAFPWSNPERITADDNSAASRFIGGGIQTSALAGRDFGFSIPSSAVIDGVAMAAKFRKSAVQVASWSFAALALDGSVVGSTRNPNVAASTSFATHTTGGSTDKWGASLTPAMVNDELFEATFAMTVSGNQTVECDYLALTIYYTEAAGGLLERGPLRGVMRGVLRCVRTVQGWFDVPPERRWRQSVARGVPAMIGAA